MAQPLPSTYPSVYMGFVGFVKLKGGVILGDVTPTNAAGDISVAWQDYIIRATTADMNLSQEITKEEVVDSRYDKTVYRLGPRLIEGTLEFPAIFELSGGNTRGIFEILYRLAATRQRQTGNLTKFDLEVKYGTSAPDITTGFLYRGCIINSWKFTVTQQELVTCSINIIGVSREAIIPLAPARKNDDTACIPLSSDDAPVSAGELGTSRIITWADARVNIVNPLWTLPVAGKFIRTFEANITNDAERFYTLNKSLYAQAVAPRKRDVDGTMTVIGRIPRLADLAESNEERCNELSTIKFGFETAQSDSTCNNLASFGVALPNCVLEIEEMTLSNDIFESTIGWHSLPSAGTGVCDPLIYNLDSVTFE